MADIDTTQDAPQQTPEVTNIHKALSGLDLLREKVKSNGDLSGRLRQMEADLNDLRRQSTSTPAIDPRMIEAVKKQNARIEKIESVQQDLIAALSALNNKTYDLERLIQALGSITDGL
jgi:ribosomal protein L29